MPKTEVAPGVEIDSDEIERETSRGFSPRDRMQNRSLRSATITLFTDEEKGPLLGDARDVFAANGQFAGRAREGILGEIDLAEFEKAKAIEAMRQETIRAAGLKWMSENPTGLFDETTVEHPEYKTPDIDKKIKALEKKRDALMEEMEATALTFSLRAVPPIIQKDCLRLAKKSQKARERNASLDADDPKYDEEWAEFDADDKKEWFAQAQTAHLLTKMIQSVKDHESGGVNTVTTFEDAMDYIDFLPPGQFSRLDFKLGELQIKDAISRSIESQEDFS